ncbi:tetratricopeptide repeat protein 8 [Elysia marginata]|uniref:Tetratricopeptide repeat protein 8 n=1 Tax=Elysia marginata TaxID=1093978 RepID=A0AAV4JLG9_9GAST|nr:tetratricopeptide repeat protein 8 [Elysia marginata]
MYRDAERQLRSALKTDETIEAYLHLAKVYCRLDQPLAAVQVYTQALSQFPGETTLLTGIARINEGTDKMDEAVKFYKEVLNSDSMHVEAIACIATNHFYSDQPEIALKFYRRLLQMGVYNAELFNNLGLCCFYAQQYDMTLTCFERALSLAEDDIVQGDIWFNLGHIGLGICDMKLAFQCFRLALSHNNDHAEAYNNLGVLELRRNHVDAVSTQNALYPHCFSSD